MGRVAGVTATETRERLLRAGAHAFASRGYDGTRVADIAASAGVSNGALYAHFGSKAELLVGALREHGRQGLADMFAADPGRPVVEMLLAIGRRLRPRPHARGELDPDVSAEALAHFCVLLTMGSALVTPDSHAVDEDEWAQLLTRLMAALAPPDSKTQTTPTQEEEPRGK